MKRIRMGLLALTAVTGIGSAFALNHKAPKAGTLYYAQKINATQSVWVRTMPTNACSQDSALECTITSTSADVTSLPPDTYPAQFSSLGIPGKAHN